VISTARIGHPEDRGREEGRNGKAEGSLGCAILRFYPNSKKQLL
jgi:hypothetical protein